MITRSCRSITSQALYLDELDRLLDINSRGSMIETTLRIRALVELSQLDSAELFALAHMVSRSRELDEERVRPSVRDNVPDSL